MFKIGIIGAGKISRRHAVAVASHAKSRLVAVADIILQRAEMLASEFGANSYANYERMFEKEELDAVIINLPHGLHCSAGEFFLKRGVHVLLEKPMANTVSECDRLIAASKQGHAKLAVGHVQKYFPAHKKVREMVEQENYGKLCMTEEIRNSDYFTESRPSWFFQKQLSGGGVLMNVGAHSLDKLLYIVGGKINSIHGNVTTKMPNKEVEGQVQLLLKMRDGISSVVSISGYSPYMYEQYFYFERATAKVTDTRLLAVDQGQGFQEIMIPQVEPITEQFNEFILYLENNPSRIVMPCYARDIIMAIEKVYQQNGLCFSCRNE